MGSESADMLIRLVAYKVLRDRDSCGRFRGRIINEGRVLRRVINRKRVSV